MKQDVSTEQRDYLNRLFIIVSTSILLPFYINVFALLGLFIYLAWTHRKDLLSVVGELKWISIFIVYTFTVSVFNQNYIGMFVAIAFLLVAVLFYFYRKYLRAETYFSILKIFALGSIALSIWAIVDYLLYVFPNGYDIFYIFKYSAIQTRAEASFFNANYYGMYCVLSILIAVYLMFRINTKKWHYLGALIIGMNIISIILTASRMLLPTVIIALVWLLFWLDKRSARIFIGIAAMIVVVLVVKPELMPRLESIDYALQDRFGLWAVGLAIFFSQPLFGRGPFSYSNFYYLYTDSADMHAHSLYVDSLANYGIVGVGLIGMFVIPYARLLIKMFKAPTIRPEFALITAFIVTVLVHGTMDVSIIWIQTGYIFLATILPKQEELEKIPSIAKTHQLKF